MSHLHPKVKKNMKPDQIAELMKDLATEIEFNQDYDEPIEPELLEECRVDLPEKLHQISVLEKERKEAMDKAKMEIDKLQAEADALVRVIHTGEIKRKGDLYHVPDYDKSIMMICLSDGKVINELPLAIGTQTHIQGEGPADEEGDD